MPEHSTLSAAEEAYLIDAADTMGVDPGSLSASEITELLAELDD